MDKHTAIAELNSRRTIPRLTNGNTRFANINASKAVWWLDLPLDEVRRTSDPFVNLALAGKALGELFHLRVPKEWLIENLGQLAIREDKDVISIELSCEPSKLFRDVRPTSGGLNFSRFRV